MNIMAAVDNAGGMLFNRRRVSMDRVLRKKVLEISADTILWMDEYSARQFREEMEDTEQKICVSENFLDEAETDDFCFVEDRALLPLADKIGKFYLFHWNRDYPSDFRLDFLPKEHGFHLTGTEDFQGYSHDDITLEVWEK